MDLIEIEVLSIFMCEDSSLALSFLYPQQQAFVLFYFIYQTEEEGLCAFSKAVPI